MTDVEQPLLCQWCGHPVPAGTWWDGRPQCSDPFACECRIRAEENRR